MGRLLLFPTKDIGMGQVRTFEAEILSNLERLNKGFAVVETKLDSVNRLAEKSQVDIREIKDSLQETNTNIAILNRDVRAVADECAHLSKVTIIGNGSPSLKQSIALLQEWKTDTTKALDGIQESVEDLKQDFDADKDQRHEEAKQDGKESKKSRLELSLQAIGWGVVIIAVVLEAVFNKFLK